MCTEPKSDEGKPADEEIRQAVRLMSETLGIPELLPADDSPDIEPLTIARQAITRLEALLQRPGIVSSLELVRLAHDLGAGAAYATHQAGKLMELAEAWQVVQGRALRSVLHAHGQRPLTGE